MKKKLLLICLAITLLLFPLAACGGGSGSARVLRVYNWGDFIDPSVIQEFEKKTGIRVEYDMFDSNEIMFAKLQGGSKYDIVFPSDYMIGRMQRADMLHSIDHSKIPNLKNIDENFLGHAFDPENEYTIPYMWGTVGILYNKKLTDGPIDSWDTLFGERYAGSIIMYDSVRDSFVPALRKLGYSINSTNPEEVAEAEALLVKQKKDKVVRSYLIDEAKSMMVGGSYALNLTYNGDAVIAMSESEDLDYVVPKEGSNIWFDNVSILKTCQDMDAAYQFIDFLCDGTVAAKNAEFIGYSSPNKAAMELIDPELVANPVFNPSQDVIDRCEAFKDLGDDMKLYEQAWERIKMTN